jgi:hypothetical protein
MSIALLDVNVLAGLLDPAHFSHEEAHRWFAKMVCEKSTTGLGDIANYHQRLRSCA